jgi:tetratricopeptide (TPR) repeat protein
MILLSASHFRRIRRAGRRQGDRATPKRHDLAVSRDNNIVMPSSRTSAERFAALPDPGQAATLADLVERLRLLKVWAGDPSYECIKDRVNSAWVAAGRSAGELARKTTVVDCFRPGRRRLNAELVVAVVQALHPDVGYVAQWRQALRVVGGEVEAAGQVRVHATLPRDLASFTGRATELRRLRSALHEERGAVVISAIEGMAGVGKTQLAVHAGHLLARERPFDRVLFVNLRGFHPDPAQPPADPAAVLDGFLRVLGMPGHRIPHDLPARSAAYRERLAGTRVLVVLDNATGEDQVRPLLPDTPGCVALVTSRRRIVGLPTTNIEVGVLSPGEALDFLARAAPGVLAGHDPTAAARIVRCCGHLPLALGLVAGHNRGTPGWTLTEHADRLEERRRERRLDAGVELAFDVSYRRLPASRQRLVRLLALHPGPDFDACAAAALTGTDLSAAQADLRLLCAEHMLQQSAVDRYVFHDLVHAFATNRAGDEDPPRARRTALTRLFDYYLAATAAAMDGLYPAETHRRPRIPPVSTPTPHLADPDVALAWLDTERPTLMAVAAHTAAQGWLTHTTRLSKLLFRYLDGGHHADAVVVHSHACRTDDPAAQAHALTNLGTAYLQLGRYAEAAAHLGRALPLFAQHGDRAGEARVLGNLGLIAERSGRYQPATEYLEQVLVLFREIGDRIGEAYTLTNLGAAEERLGWLREAADHHHQALALFRQAGDRIGEAHTLTNLGDAEIRLGQYTAAGEHLHQALVLSRKRGNDNGEVRALNGLGVLHVQLDQPGKAAEYHRRALTIARHHADQQAEALALNGLGEAVHALGHPAEALTHYWSAHDIATTIGAGDQHARAHARIGRCHGALRDPASARHHYRHAFRLYTDLGMPDAEEIRTRVAGTGQL